MVFERKRLGAFLREKRLAKGLSQASVSSQLGYSSPQFISNWERGVSAPPLKALGVLVRLYGLTRDELIDVIVQETVETLKGPLEPPQAEPCVAGP